MTVDWHLAAREAGLRVRERPAPEAIAAAEQALDCTLSPSLRALYEQTDGLVDEWNYQYVLSLSELVEENRLFRVDYRGLYMPFDGLLIFGRLGNGDLMFQPLLPDRRDQVYRWDHEDDSRTWYGADVAEAVRRVAGLMGEL